MLRKAALVEGSTLILLVLIAVPLKRLAGMPEVVSIVGPIHGLAFLVYLGMLILFLSKDVLTKTQWGTGLIAAFIPFGSFVFERKILSQKN
jgi:integral membrane protein